MEQEVTSELPDELVEELEAVIKQDTMRESRATRIMLELVKCQRADFLLLRDDDVRKWWGQILKHVETTISERKRRWNEYTVKVAAYERLLPEERRALGIRKPSKPQGKNPFDNKSKS